MDNLNNLHSSKVLLDESTGEIVYLTVKEVNMVEESRDNHLKISTKDSENKHMKSDGLFNQYVDETCGNFYFNYYLRYEVNQYIFRYIYLCTYMNYDGFLEFGNAKNEGRLVTKSDLFEMLNLSKRECYNTIDYLVDNKLITFEDKYIKINSNICVKGKIESKKDVVRMFNKAIQSIYLNSLPKEHKKLALLIKLLPYVHYDTNVICDNPTEEYKELIKPYSLTQISTILKYSTVQKFKKGLMDLKVNNESVIMITKINNKNMIVVNPKIYYKGNNLDKMQGIISLFKIAS